MTKIKICIEDDCKNVQTTENYCRLHYLKNWKLIKEAVQKKAADKLNKYVDGICKKYPEKYVDVIRKDIRSGGRAEAEINFEDAGVNDVLDSFNESFGFQDEESVEKIVSKIRVEKEF